jgi:hypothetical protein
MRRRALIAALPLLFAPALTRAEEPAKRRRGGMSYIPIYTLTANMARADGRRGVFSVEAGLDIHDPGLRARADAMTPVLRDAYASSLFVYAASLRPERVPDLDVLAARLQADTDRVLGRPGARLLLGTCLVE